MRSVCLPKAKPKKRTPTWEIRRIKATPAAFVGLVYAPDRASAVKAAIKQYGIRPQDQKSLIAVQHR